ncbi:hypothetical protein MTQ13_03210 [Streptomyces sp. XM4011]|uniref:hypothetical protein n=1 Tax=Streptomyces sp. XM4011 TaxID=2929780 RepID=UPI001FF7C4A8|nr:hypothetical protein [Streptomyces sp. XM4011]MCK1813290.1 hypothetical protein [Streptomyces sp. XM4011]
MLDPISPLGKAAAGQLAALSRAASNPLTVVKHGKREDRAAAYDRFLHACAQAVASRDPSVFEDAGRVDGPEIFENHPELWAAWYAINLRANKPVRDAAHKLVRQVARIADPGVMGMWERYVAAIEWGGPNPGLELEFGEDISQSATAVFLRELDEFVRAARIDLMRRWWHAPLPGPVRRWYLNRRHNADERSRPWDFPRIDTRVTRDLLDQVNQYVQKQVDPPWRAISRLLTLGLEAEAEAEATRRNGIRKRNNASETEAP